ncbi:MAG: sugar phosphate isomerase/epimerase [Pirellulales bacterium]|nr:sugar phosphate isomerase/epimerase [Pirellulales bacterium]
MARLSMNEVTTYRWSFEEDVAHYARAGIPAIGVWRQKLSDFGEEKGIELLEESGLAVSNLLWGGGFTGSDGRSFRDSVDDARDAIRLAGAMKAGCLVLYTGGRGGHTHGHARRLFRDALAQLVPLAGELNVPLAIEPMHVNYAADWTFLTCLDDTLELMVPFDANYVRLAFDTYHFGDHPQLLARIPELAARVSIVHLADSHKTPGAEQNRCPLGTGALPLKEILSGFAAAGYDGYCDVELFGEAVENADYALLLRDTQRAFHHLSACQVA